MSRSGYNEACDNWELIRWRGAVASATKGERGQKLLKEMADALDAMPEKRLIAQELEASGEVCALGCLGKAKGIEIKDIDPTDYDTVANVFGIAPALAREIAYVNDDWGYHTTPEQRWKEVRGWVQDQIKTTLRGG